MPNNLHQILKSNLTDRFFEVKHEHTSLHPIQSAVPQALVPLI